MGKQVKVALVVLTVALIGVIVWYVAHRPDKPIYQGRTLTNWLGDFGAVQVTFTPPRRGMAIASTREANEAVHQIGTNAIPTLLALLRVKDSALKVKLIYLLQRQHLLKFRLRPAEEWNAIAACAFSVVGTNAKPAVPELIAIANQNISKESRCSAIGSLGGIGPAAAEAIPFLFQCMTNADSQVRSAAYGTMLLIDPKAAAKAGVAITKTAP